MKKLLSIAILGAFVAGSTIGCSDSKPAPKAAEVKPGEKGDGPRTPPK